LPFTNPSPKAITYHSEILERPGLLDVLQSLVQVLQFLINHTLRLLSTLNSLGLESLNGLHLPFNIIGCWLECLELFLDIVYDSAVLEDAAVVLEVDCLGVFRELLDLPARVVVAFFKGD